MKNEKNITIVPLLLKSRKECIEINKVFGLNSGLWTKENVLDVTIRIEFFEGFQRWQIIRKG